MNRSQDEKDSQVVMPNSLAATDACDQSETWSVPHSLAGETDDGDTDGEASAHTIGFPVGTNVMFEDINYHILQDNHFMSELPGLDEDSEDDDIFCPVPPKKKTRVQFSYDPIKVICLNILHHFHKLHQTFICLQYHYLIAWESILLYSSQNSFHYNTNKT